MVTLSFLACLAAIVGVVLAIEADGTLRLRSERSTGLLTWLTSGNWPAKVGGAFVIVGVGALLRYALINIEIAAEIKLGGGAVIALTLGLASMFVPDGPAKRPISLALGGAAFGVAYLRHPACAALDSRGRNRAAIPERGIRATLHRCSPADHCRGDLSQDSPAARHGAVGRRHPLALHFDRA